MHKLGAERARESISRASLTEGKRLRTSWGVERGRRRVNRMYSLKIRENIHPGEERGHGSISRGR